MSSSINCTHATQVMLLCNSVLIEVSPTVGYWTHPHIHMVVSTCEMHGGVCEENAHKVLSMNVVRM